MRRRNRFHRRRSGQHYPPRTVRCPSPTRLRRVARDATRYPAQLEPRQCAVSSKWFERPRPTWVQCTAGDFCAETTSLCALDMAQQLPLWFRSWHYRSVYYTMYINLPKQDTHKKYLTRHKYTTINCRLCDCVTKSRSMF